jgi:hypothetical protein
VRLIFGWLFLDRPRRRNYNRSVARVFDYDYEEEDEDENQIASSNTPGRRSRIALTVVAARAHHAGIL